MTIGLSFPVKDHDKIKSVPWSLLEQNRSRAMKNHGASLERLHALGGLSAAEVARIVTDQDMAAPMADSAAEKILGTHQGEVK